MTCRASIPCWAILLILLSAIYCFGQAGKSVSPKKNGWKPIGCLYDSFGVEGLTDEDLEWSFGNGIQVEGRKEKVTSAEISTVAGGMTESVGLSLDIRYIDSPGFGMKAFAERKVARDGTIVLDTGFLEDVLGSPNGWDFFRATIAHEIGHFIIRKNTPLPYKISVSQTLTSNLTDLGLVDFPLSEIAEEEMICDVWAGYVFAKSPLPSEPTLTAILIKWKDLGSTAKLQESLHGAPLTRGELFIIGLDFEILAKKGYEIDTVKVIKIDRDSNRLHVVLADMVLAYCHPEDVKCKWWPTFGATAKINSSKPE